jgi:hypothetical protein
VALAVPASGEDENGQHRECQQDAGRGADGEPDLLVAKPSYLRIVGGGAVE